MRGRAGVESKVTPSGVARRDAVFGGCRPGRAACCVRWMAVPARPRVVRLRCGR
jgi:hypothetical protein